MPRTRPTPRTACEQAHAQRDSRWEASSGVSRDGGTGLQSFRRACRIGIELLGHLLS